MNNEEVFYGRYFIVKRVPNNLDFSRFGIIASKKTGGAVTRNRIKRLGREVMRSQQFSGFFDIVLIAKRLCAEADFNAVSVDLAHILHKAGLI